MLVLLSRKAVRTVLSTGGVGEWGAGLCDQNNEHKHHLMSHTSNDLEEKTLGGRR